MALTPQQQAQINAEIARKAKAGIALTNTGNAQNMALYNQLKQAQAQTPVKPTTTTTGSNMNAQGTVVNPNLLDINKTVTPTTPTTQQYTGVPMKTGIIYDPQAKVWVDQATGKVQEQMVIAPQPTTTPTTTDLSGNIKSMYTSQNEALLSALKQRISESKAAQENLIKQAPKQYDPLRASSEVSKAQQLRSVLEQSANMGDRGGVGRMEALGTQIAGDARLNAINLQQQNFIDNANAEIARLENEGKFEEATILANSKTKELQDLMSEQIRQQGITREDASIAKADAEKLKLENQQSEIAKLYALNPNTTDYQAEKLKIANDGDPTNDYLIAELDKIRNTKVSSQQEAEKLAYERKIAEAKTEDAKQEEALKLAQWRYEQGLPADAITAQLLGVKEGSIIPSALLDQAKFELDKIKEARISSGSGSSSKKETAQETVNKPKVTPPKSITLENLPKFLYDLKNAGDLINVQKYYSDYMNDIEYYLKNGTETQYNIAKKLKQEYNKYL